MNFDKEMELMMKAHMPEPGEDRDEILQKAALYGAQEAFWKCAAHDYFPTNWRRPEDLADDIFSWLNTFMQPEGIPPKTDKP